MPQHASTTMNAIESVHVKGFRSLADFRVDDLSNIVVMIGPNGAGKSNVIRFFEMLGWMLTAPRRLARYVRWQGGADDQLFGGHSRTERIEAYLALRTSVGRTDYRFVLAHTNPDRLEFDDERFRLHCDGQPGGSPWQELGSGHPEAKILEARSAQASPEGSVAAAIVDTLRSCSCYQFHDTSDHSRIKKTWDASDWRRLRGDGGNLAAVLHFLEQNDLERYECISHHIGRTLPIFDRFALEKHHDRVILRWKAKGSDKTFGAHLTSDGSLRLFALVTLLNLPLDMLPDVILLDEPELGLHPAALSLVGGMIRSLASQRQIIVATQSSLLVDVFELDQLFVLDLKGDATTVRTLKSDDYCDWLEEYSTGQLWEKNLLGGYPEPVLIGRTGGM